MAQKRYIEPIVYEIGKDISHERYNEALEKIALWYEQTRPAETEHLSAARQQLQECLLGVTKDGQKWFAAATSTLAARIKIKCRFDIDKMIPLVRASDARRDRKRKEKDRAKKKQADERIDPMLPETLRREVERDAPKGKKVVYGDDPSMLLSSEEHRKWLSFKEAYMRQFPAELGSISAQAELETLCDLHILNERHRLKLLKKDGHVDPMERKSVVDQLDKLKTSLGIHPNQLAKRVQAKTDTTIGAAAARLEQMGDWRQLRQRFFAEEMIQLYQAYSQPTADGLDYQLDEVGLFGATKCMTCACARCGHRNFVGLSIDDVEQHLVKLGHLKPRDSVPTYERPEDEEVIDLAAGADEDDEEDPDAPTG